jgi:drug/metabolite transporter (DMT)-like permease
LVAFANFLTVFFTIFLEVFLYSRWPSPLFWGAVVVTGLGIYLFAKEEMVAKEQRA